MSYTILFAVLFLVVVARLRLTFRDDGARRSDLAAIGIVPLLSLVFLDFGAAWLVLLVFFPALALLMQWTERDAKRRNPWRLTSLVACIVVLAILCSPAGGLRANGLAGTLIDAGADLLFPGRSISGVDILRIELYAFGLAVVLNEANILLRYLLQVLQLAPREELDEQEYNTGRVIGMLERIFVYIFVLTGQYAAIGFILAAKGVARFREFENRTFAEYVLIGTLLSTLLALFVGHFVRWAVSL